MSNNPFNKAPTTTNNAPAQAPAQALASSANPFAGSNEDQDLLPLLPAGVTIKGKVLDNGYRVQPKKQGSNMGTAVYLDIEVLELLQGEPGMVKVGSKCSARISGFDGTAAAAARANNKKLLKCVFPELPEDTNFETLPFQVQEANTAVGRELYIETKSKQTKSFDTETKQFRKITVIDTAPIA